MEGNTSERGACPSVKADTIDRTVTLTVDELVWLYGL